MTGKRFPLTAEQVEALTRRFPTPFHLYDERGIREQTRQLYRAFAWNDGFREYFAVKATPNPFLLVVLQAEGCGADCSSLTELMLASRVGMRGEDLMFTSNDTPPEEFHKARELDAIINLDDLTHLDFLQRVAGLPDRLCFRYNPGPVQKGNAIIGHPEEAKYGFTREQLYEGIRNARAKGVRRFGLHTMVVSNELRISRLTRNAELLFEVAAELAKALGVRFEFLNLGGGIGIPYRPEQKPVDVIRLGQRIRKAYQQILEPAGLTPVRLFMECGRFISGPFGWLVSRVLHVKRTYRTFVGLDACMANLMRPGMYDAYHHITVVGKESWPHDHIYDVTGSLCENNDKFAKQRALPEIQPGDLVVIHDTGAHGHAMGFNYNGKLRSAELLLRENGEIVEIRRAETPEDYFATLDFARLAEFRA